VQIRYQCHSLSKHVRLNSLLCADRRIELILWHPTTHKTERDGSSAALVYSNCILPARRLSKSVQIQHTTTLQASEPITAAHAWAHAIALLSRSRCLSIAQEIPICRVLSLNSFATIDIHTKLPHQLVPAFPVQIRRSVHSRVEIRINRRHAHLVRWCWGWIFIIIIVIVGESAVRSICGEHDRFGTGREFGTVPFWQIDVAVVDHVSWSSENIAEDRLWIAKSLGIVVREARVLGLWPCHWGVALRKRRCRRYTGSPCVPIGAARFIRYRRETFCGNNVHRISIDTPGKSQTW
jgi:hypothetical protein